ncbi:hypothetical protein [Paenibacillus sp. An7]|uniref:hypothetical protein n=1 Tax=Paenibacillus sp. An7 TaxID=2689577 RepID=UPI001359E668|nr:hypothetical protein [Paenibacillus sp. An7]
MKKKKKMIGEIGGLLLLIAVIFAVYIFITGMPSEQKFNEDGEVTIHYLSRYIDAVPEDFKTAINEEMAEKMFGSPDFYNKMSEKDTLKLDATLSPNGEFYKAEGEGSLTIFDKEYPFTVSSSQLDKEVLQSGDHLVWGSISGGFVDEGGIKREMILSLSTVIETEEVFYYATLGGVVISFGDFGFETKEIRDILLNNPI